MSSELTVARPRPVAVWAGRGPWWWLDRLALATALLSGLVLYALIGRGGWYVDDFLNFGIAQHEPLGRKYLETTIFGHPQPGTRLVNWLLFRIAPMNYHLAAALVCLVLAFSVWMIYRILRLAFQPSPWHLILTTMAGVTGLWVPVAAWWAGGSEIAGCVVANVLTVHAVLRCYLGPRRWLWAVLAGVWMLGGLAFYERALFGGLFAGWFVLAVGCRTIRLRELGRVLRRVWPAFASLLVVAALYLYYYSHHQFVRAQPGYTGTEVLHFLWICWSNSLIPGLFGGSLRTGQIVAESYAAPPLWWLVCCQLLLVGLFAWGIRRNGLRPVLAWLVFLVLFVPAQYAIARARLHVHGPGIGQEFRYLADLLPLLVLTMALTVLRPSRLPSPGPDGRHAPAAAEHAGPPPAADADPDEAAAGPAADAEPVGQPARPGWRDRLRASRPAGRRGSVIATAVVLALFWTAFLVSGVPVAQRWHANRGVEYVDNLRAEVASHDRQGPWTMYTTYAPQSVCPNAFGRYCLAPSIAELVSGHPVSTDDTSRPMYVVDPAGHLRAARFQPFATVPAACSTGQQRILQPLSKPLAKGLWNVQLSYRVSQPTTLRFALDPGTGTPIEATGAFQGFPVTGSGRLTFLIRLTSIKAFRLDAAVPGACISDVQIGLPVAAG